MHLAHRTSLGLMTLLLVATAVEGPAHAQGLITLNPPQGGRIVYGPVAGQTTEAGAMAAVLHAIHMNHGVKPQVGRLFEVKGTQSVAAFFSVNNRTGSGQVAGLIIVAKATSDHVEAAEVTDDAARFPRTLGPMMKTLMAQWHPIAAGGGGGASGPAAALHRVTTQDNSCSIGLPEGWKLVPNMSMMGSLVAVGPNGEAAEMGIAYLAMDTNNPRVRQTMQAVQMGRLQGTVYANATYYPYGGDMARTYVDFTQNIRRKAHLTAASYHFDNVTQVAAPYPERCVEMTGTADLGDGKGARESHVVFCSNSPAPGGTYMSLSYSTLAPVQVAARERATLGAIFASFGENMQVVDAQAARIAAPAIARIHAIGEAAANQARAAHARNDIQNSSVYKRWDDNDKRSQEFENYQLGYSVISDSEHNAHGTFWNDDADALVKSNPDRFEFVSAPDYWKGIDY